MANPVVPTGELGLVLSLGWRRPPDRPRLAPGEVHLWRADLAAPVKLDGWRRMLSDAERDRAGRFYFARDRDSFIARRGLLREILAGYVGAPPEALVFHLGPHGKPTLAPPPGNISPHFSLSHSRGRVIYAFSLHSRVGVDMEQLRADFDVLAMARLYFLPDQVTALSRLTREGQSQEFFRLWTRLEACLKAKGTGLAGLATTREARRHLARPAEARAPRRGAFCYEDLTPWPGFVASLAVVGNGHRLAAWAFGGEGGAPIPGA